MSVQVFAFTEYSGFQALLDVECREITKHRAITHNSLSELREMMEIFSEIDVLIIDEPEDPKRCHEIINFLGEFEGRFKRVLILGEKITPRGVMKRYRRIDIAELFEDLKTIVNPDYKEEDGWAPISISTLAHFQNLPFDIYVKISPERYVKRIPAFEDIDEEVLKNFTSRGVEDLFCESRHNREFSRMLISNMVDRIEQEYDTLDEKFKAHNEVFLTTRQIIQELGLSTRVIEVCESAIERITQDVMVSRDQFSGYLTALKNNPELAFHYKLVELTSFVAAQLINGMDMENKTDQVRKLVFASFFCDMTLSQPEFIHIRRADQIENRTLEEVNEINFHALKASELVLSYRNTPKEVALIIRQHHGSFSGIGFPKQRSSDLLPLSKILLISQDLAYDILVEQEGSVLDVLKSFARKHQHSGFQELLHLLEGNVGRNLQELA